LISVQGKRASRAPDRQTDIMVMEEVTREYDDDDDDDDKRVQGGRSVRR
jgi:hypothetical protein